MKKKKIFILLAGLAVASAVIGFYMYNKPHKNYEKAKPDFFVTADKLYEDFNRDEHQSNQNYISKVIEVSGSPVLVDKHDNGNVTIYLEDDLMGVSCTFDSIYAAKNSDKFKLAQDKETLKIKGRCDGFLTDVRLSKCSFN